MYGGDDGPGDDFTADAPSFGPGPISLPPIARRTDLPYDDDDDLPVRTTYRPLPPSEPAPWDPETT